MRSAAIFMLVMSVLWAHKLTFFSNYDNGLLYVESYFANGSPCQNCKITVLDKEQKELFSALLDNKGVLQKEVTLNDEVTIKVSAGEGHAATKVMSLATKDEPKQNVAELPTKTQYTDTQELKSIISQELDKKINPILAKLDKSDETSVEKIISGIGYIFGLFGVAMFLKCRKNGNS